MKHNPETLCQSSRLRSRPRPLLAKEFSAMVRDISDLRILILVLLSCRIKKPFHIMNNPRGQVRYLERIRCRSCSIRRLLDGESSSRCCLPNMPSRFVDIISRDLDIILGIGGVRMRVWHLLVRRSHTAVNTPDKTRFGGTQIVQ